MLFIKWGSNVAKVCLSLLAFDLDFELSLFIFIFLILLISSQYSSDLSGPPFVFLNIVILLCLFRMSSISLSIYMSDPSELCMMVKGSPVSRR